MIKIAVIGGTGLLGSNLVSLFSKDYDVRAFSRGYSSNIKENFNYIIDFNFLDLSLNNQFKAWKPDIIINTVAVVNIELCENSYSMAEYVNCEIASQLANIALKFNSYFIHVSTDHFFNNKDMIHNEEHDVELLNNYAITKFNAEKSVLKICDNALVVRTNIIGFRRRMAKSFFEWLLDSLKNEKKIELFTDYFTSPISVNQLGNILIRCYLHKNNGLFNIASSEVIDKYSFGIKVAEKFEYSVKNISPKKFKDNKLVYPNRALSLGLDISKIEASLKEKMPTINETLDELRNENERYLNE